MEALYGGTLSQVLEDNTVLIYLTQLILLAHHIFFFCQEGTSLRQLRGTPQPESEILKMLSSN